MKKPETEALQKIATEAYQQAHREMADLIKELYGNQSGTPQGGLWAACMFGAKQGIPWDDE